MQRDDGILIECKGFTQEELENLAEHLEQRDLTSPPNTFRRKNPFQPADVIVFIQEAAKTVRTYAPAVLKFAEPVFKPIVIAVVIDWFRQKRRRQTQTINIYDGHGEIVRSIRVPKKRVT